MANPKGRPAAAVTIGLLSTLLAVKANQKRDMGSRMEPGKEGGRRVSGGRGEDEGEERTLRR